MKTAVILSAARTPVGKFQGGLSSLAATELGAIAVRAALTRSELDPGAVSEVIMGNVLAAGLGQNPARQAALAAGLPPAVAAMTINKVCGSGLKSVMLAAQAIRLGDADVVVAGGQENMSATPYLLPKARQGYRMGHGELVDSMVRDGLWCAHCDWHMGSSAEHVAEKFSVTREEQDRYAYESHQKAIAARDAGAFNAELVEVTVPGRKGDTVVAHDESPREDTTVEKLGRLRPAFTREGGTVTAGNAPGVNDGAAAVVVTSEEKARSLRRTPLARIVGYSVSGVDPKLVMMAPVDAVNSLLERVGWDRDEVDLYELNEAFSVQAIAVTRELKLDPAKVNVNGGAVALGHPIGASGGRVLVTLLHALAARNLERGVVALCLGGGNAVAMAVERSA